MEGFDIRTLALTSLLLSVLLGIGSFVFARVHSSFRGFYQLGIGYFSFALGFVFIGLRKYIDDFLSIIVGNFLIAFGFTIVIIGILKFLHYPKQRFIKVSTLLLVILFLLFIHFTYFQENTSMRIIVICSFIFGQSFYAAYKTYGYEEIINNTFIRFLTFSCLFCGVTFLIRVYITLNSTRIDDFMQAGYVHAASLVALQLLVITSCLSLSWSASQQLAHKLKIQATIDSLTNLYNRRAFEEFAQKSINRAQREKTYIAIILMDIDLFKQVNDTYGHQAGDKVLQEFSQRLKDSLRPYDILARYGGEEFMLLLPDTDIDTALTIAEKLRVTIAQPVFDVATLPRLEVSASFGVASARGDKIDWQKLVGKADCALYQAKENGRNQVQGFKNN
jgi:diguanylate cyclase (GGDEF)-like protein